MISMLDTISEELQIILDDIDNFQLAYQDELQKVHRNNRRCTANLVDYLAFRSKDRSRLQSQLTQFGLSSLGRSEAAIKPQLLRVKALIDRISGKPQNWSDLFSEAPQIMGQRNLEENSTKLFGPEPDGRHTRIMVTMPSEAAVNVELVKSFLHAGMNVARINCAHDSPPTWRLIAKNIRNYSAILDIPCQIMMDLAGPKLRTGAMAEGARVIKVKPPKDSRGRVITPAQVEFFCRDVAPPSQGKTIRLPLDCEWNEEMLGISEIRMIDARWKKRKLTVTQSKQGSLLATVPATTYFETGQKLQLQWDNRQTTVLVGSIDAQENYLSLQLGDQLKLVSNDDVAKPMSLAEDHSVLQPATVSCGVPEALAAPDIGHQIKLDDGKFTGEVIEKGDGWLLLDLIEAPIGGGKLKAEKGINFPDTELPISGLTNKDIEDLDTICDIADIIALSFVNRSEDVTALRSEIKQRRSEDIGIILKIETRLAFENLPELLMTAMQSEKIGVMVARGDLGVEIGWRQMAQKQDEILWLCAAAHIPSIWATQVLETMAKTGQPTRSEITDAAMAQRAECVMLNKGPYIHKAVKMLHRIIRTMDTHQYKKSARLPKLSCRVTDISAVLEDEALVKLE